MFNLVCGLDCSELTICVKHCLITYSAVIGLQLVSLVDCNYGAGVSELRLPQQFVNGRR